MKLLPLLFIVLLSSSPLIAEKLDQPSHQTFKKKKKKKKHKKKKEKKGQQEKSSPKDSWVGPSWRQAKNLSDLGDFKKNLSGAHWNSKKQRLYVVINNPATIYELSLENMDFIQTKKISAKGDFEGITMTSDDSELVYVMGEGCECIIEYNVKTQTRNKEWRLDGLIKASGNQGPEGIAFIPDEFLDEAIGTSKLGMNGLFVIAHQNGGDLYFYDLDLKGSKANLIKKVATRSSESSGLEFDVSEAKLYIWHNVGSNSIEIVKPTLNESGYLDLIKHIDGPKTGNLEGISVGRVAEGEHYLFFTDDDNQDGYALFWYDDHIL